MSNHDPKVTLQQLAEFGRMAQGLCENHTLESLLKDWKGLLALERLMEVMGEAVKRLPEELRERYPAVEWKAIIGMRDHLSHGVSMLMSQPIEILWNSVQNKVPMLILTVEQMQRDLER